MKKTKPVERERRRERATIVMIRFQPHRHRSLDVSPPNTWLEIPHVISSSLVINPLERTSFYDCKRQKGTSSWTLDHTYHIHPINHPSHLYWPASWRRDGLYHPIRLYGWPQWWDFRILSPKFRPYFRYQKWSKQFRTHSIGISAKNR